MGGGGFSMEAEPSVLDDYVLSPAPEPRICLHLEHRLLRAARRRYGPTA